MPDNPTTGEKLLLQIIDKVFAIVTAAPQAGTDLGPDKQGSNRLQPKNTVVQLAIPGIPLYAEDFKDMYHPSNPGGQKGKTALFSWLVDAIPTAGTLKYEQTPRRVSLAYKAIVMGANAPVAEVDAELKRRLATHNAVLYGADGAKTADYKEFQKRQDDLGAAQDDLRHVAAKASKMSMEYQDEVAHFDKKPGAEKKRIIALYERKAQDYFDDVYPAAKRVVLRALDELNDVRMNRVAEALTFINTNGKELSAQLLDSMKKQLAASEGAEGYTDQALKVPVMLSYPSHTAFAKPGASSGWMSISCNTDTFDLSQSQTAKRTGAGAGGFWSLFFFRAGGGHTEATEKIDVTSSSVQVSFDLAIVNILRPWMDATLFSGNVEWNAGRDQKKGSVSSGAFETQTDDHLLPFVPTQMLVARNVKIVGAFNEAHQTFVKSHMDAGGSFGWGPFSFGGSHTQDSASFTKREDGSGVTLKLEGIQCIGFVSWIPPLSAKDDGRADAAPLNLPGAEELNRQKAAAQQAVAIMALPPKSRPKAG